MDPTSKEPTSKKPTSSEPPSSEPTLNTPTSEEPTSNTPTSEEPTSKEPRIWYKVKSYGHSEMMTLPYRKESTDLNRGVPAPTRRRLPLFIELPRASILGNSATLRARLVV